MNGSKFNTAGSSLVPLGAGDIIDRAVRFYRKHFATLVLIAAPPVIIGTVLSVVWLQIARQIFFTSGYSQVETTLYVFFTFLGTIIIWFAQTVTTFTVMGGASRNFVRHLLFDEPISFAATYRNVRERLAGLLLSSALIVAILGVLGIIAFYICLLIATILISLTMLFLSMLPPIAFILSVVFGVATLAAAYWLFCLLASRFAYVPQVMLVEEQGVFASIGRSMSLASGNVKRFAALLAFTTLAAYSALAILYIPLGWYAWYQGVEFFSFDNAAVPAWLEISQQLIWQASFVIMSPVWMIGLCLLYVDERVRHEGYDIELLAAANMGDIPDVPSSYVNPLQPALGSIKPVEAVAAVENTGSMLGLK
ncbi:MAG: hypothetical protein KF685_02180 [Acidobacteria bacterium]|nr:hypothetical protein [Acidobacteriota bacterium]